MAKNRLIIGEVNGVRPQGGDRHPVADTACLSPLEMGAPKDLRLRGDCRGAMEKQRTIITEWLVSKSPKAIERLLSELGQSMHMTESISVDGIIEQLAAGLMATCASELGLSPMELNGLLRTPRRDALAGLVTVLRNDV